MIKIVCLFNRKPGLTMREFRDYYENNHVPLVTKLLPQPRTYSRSYAREDRDYVAPHGHADRPVAARAFDVLTELIFDSEEDYQKMVTALSDPEIRRTVARDEARFFDRASMRTYFVDEYR